MNVTDISRESVEQLVRDCDAWSECFGERTEHRDVLRALLSAKEQAERERDEARARVEMYIKAANDRTTDMFAEMRKARDAAAERDALKALCADVIAIAELAKIWMQRADNYVENNQAEYAAADLKITTELTRARSLL